MMWRRFSIVAGVTGLACSTPPVPDIQRSSFDEWLRTSEVSPYAAVYHQPMPERLVFGPAALPPLSDLPAVTLEAGGSRLIMQDGARRNVPRNRPVQLGAGWHIRISGENRSSFVTVFAPEYHAEPPGWFPVDSMWVVEGTLEAPESSTFRPMLGLDGVRVEATLAGTFVAQLHGDELRLVVYRMPEPGSDSEEHAVFFRDLTNQSTTYTAGRFLTLRPLGGGRFAADFNMARNPFCAYNPIYPCPLPWRGNDIATAIEAGERYKGGGLEVQG